MTKGRGMTRRERSCLETLRVLCTVDRVSVLSPQESQHRSRPWCQPFSSSSWAPPFLSLDSVWVGQNLPLPWKRACIWRTVCEKITALHSWDPWAGLGEERLGFPSSLCCVVLGTLLIIFANQFPYQPNWNNNKASELGWGDCVRGYVKMISIL